MHEAITTKRVGHLGCEEIEWTADSLARERGVLWLWEEPQGWADYVIGCDPTFGRAGWTRGTCRPTDDDIDNAAIEVFRKGDRRKNQPDVQVAEWAAPVDAQDLAEVCNYIGRLFGGRQEDGQALMCIEVWPGTGWLTQRELISRFGYTNLPPWLVEGAGLSQRMTHKFGWISNSSTRRDLWTRGTSHLQRHAAVIRSPWFVEEMVDCTPDNFLAVTARSMGGRHDDRVVAGLIGLWYCQEWALGAEPTEPSQIESANAPEWQASDVSATDMDALWGAHVAGLSED